MLTNPGKSFRPSRYTSIKVPSGAFGPQLKLSAMTLTLTPEETEMVYFALNEYALKYIHASTTFARTAFQKDYAHEKAERIGQLQIKVGDLFIETK